MDSDIQSDRIIRVVFNAVDELNLLLLPDRGLKKSLDVNLSGDSGELDSLGLINLIVATEEKIEEEFGISISLADEQTMAQKDKIFKSLGTFTDHIVFILKGKNVGKY